MKQNDTYSLYELNGLVREAIERTLSDEYWVQAEMSSVSVKGGHCYIELVEKNEHGNGMIAKARAMVWARIFNTLKPYFEQQTGQAFAPGINVRLLVTPVFHELYGFSYEVQSIDPTFTLGDMARRRREILLRLQQDGTLTLNRELDFPLLPRRVAVISSDSAAGYGDFCRQLAADANGFAFTVKLFPAIMQGDRVEASIIKALEAIAAEQELWDVVIIIRGGGAVSDLAGFDTYELASNCAQFPLPIITGIGHDRDETVLDVVAHTSVKTPTAVADFLVECMANAADHLLQDMNRLSNGLMQRLAQENQRLQNLTLRLPAAYKLQKATAEHALERYSQRLIIAISTLLQNQRHKLELDEKVLDGASPERILQRGYSITLVNGHAVRSAADLQPDEVLLTRFADGQVYSKVLCKEETTE